jgi:hypothetical protein
MNRILLTLSLLGLSFCVQAQNKTFSVGTPTPNTNAALHVESPTNNQGIIIPRLTTAQRTSFTGALSATDVGLIVFDTDLRALTIWNGTAWDVGMKTGEPVTASNAATTGLAGLFENSNPANANPALQVNTAGSGNAITANAPIQATSFIGDGSALTGVGLTLPYSNSVSTAAPALSISNTSGTHPAASFSSNHSTDGTLVATSTGFVAISARQTGTAGMAGQFVNNNPGNNFDALQGISDGTGNAIYGQSSGTGKAGFFYVTQSSNASAALEAQTLGQGAAISGYNGNAVAGSAANFVVGQAGNSSPAVNIIHSGTGNAITANAPIQASSFIGDGSGLTNLNSDFGAQLVQTVGTLAGAEVAVDYGGSNTGDTGFSLHFGSAVSGEAIGSKRDAGVGQYGLDFYTADTKRMTIANTGEVGIGTITPAAKLDIIGDIKITDGTHGPGKVLTSDVNGKASWQTVVVGTKTVYLTTGMFEQEGFSNAERDSIPTSNIRVLRLPESSFSSTRITVPLPDYGGGSIVATINYTSDDASGDFQLRFYSAGLADGTALNVNNSSTLNPILPAVATAYAASTYNYTLTAIDPLSKLVTLDIERWGTIDPADTSTGNFLLLGISLTYEP